MRRVQSFPTVIVDKNALFRIGLAHTLAETRYRVIAQYSALSDLPANFVPSAPCLLFIGLDKDVKSSIIDVSNLKQKRDSVRIILLGEQLDQTEFLSVIELSGDSYMRKDKINPDLLLKSLELVMSGQVVFPREFLQRLNSQWSRGPNSEAPDNASAMSWELQDAASPIGRSQTERHLSDRETAILVRLMHGASNKHIARELEIAEATVKVHVKSVLRKIRVKNRTQAATWALTRCSSQGVPGDEPHAGAQQTPVGLGHASTGVSPDGELPGASARGIVSSEILAKIPHVRHNG
jgi:two-component system, NarL family, nitrate/nitrite response regulator NarL